ncbi:MAG: type I-MYXAN CRISPR-associated protein Cas6/Cmx6 [Gammaproteobacteria bacterium]|nr:type I-MYXAN CRISPR-associated protein Cas6/Cmx6 [Gammaproteobacteria bacterium]
MHWQDDGEQDNVSMPDGVVDLMFSIRCKSLPLDHGYALQKSVSEKLCWIKHEPQAAIHQIHVAESAHGWQRPQGKDSVLLPSKRSKLILRMPMHRLADCNALCDQILDIDGHSLHTESFKSRPLSTLTTIFARYIETQTNEEDDEFIQRMLGLLQAQGIVVKKMMSGMVAWHNSDSGEILTRKLMLSGLSVEDSLRLQQCGLGRRMQMGIGIFLPHKGIDAFKPG